MEIKDAVQAAENNENVQEHLKEGFYLSSVMAIPETLTEIHGWTLVYFHPETKKVFSVDVKAGSVLKSPPSDPLIQDHYEKLDFSGALGTKALLSKLVGILAKEKEVPTKVIITLRDGEWKVAIVTQAIQMLRIDLEMKTGEVKNIEKSSMLKPA